MHAVLNPCSAAPMAARRPAPPAPTTTTSYSWSMIGYSVEEGALMEFDDIVRTPADAVRLSRLLDA